MKLAIVKETFEPFFTQHDIMIAVLCDKFWKES